MKLPKQEDIAELRDVLSLLLGNFEDLEEIVSRFETVELDHIPEGLLPLFEDRDRLPSAKRGLKRGVIAASHWAAERKEKAAKSATEMNNDLCEHDNLKGYCPGDEDWLNPDDGNDY